MYIVCYPLILPVLMTDYFSADYTEPHMHCNMKFRLLKPQLNKLHQNKPERYNQKQTLHSFRYPEPGGLAFGRRHLALHNFLQALSCGKTRSIA